MKVKEVYVRIGRTFNLGDYESMRIDEGVTLQVEEGETSTSTINEGLAYLKQKLYVDAKEYKQELNLKEDEDKWL